MCRELAINTLERTQNSRWPSCESIIMAEVDKSIAASKKDFESFPPGYNYEELVLNVLWDVAYNLVTSGTYHVYAGVLNFIGEQLKSVCCSVAKEAKDKGYLTEEYYKIAMSNLSYGIKTVG